MPSSVVTAAFEGGLVNHDIARSPPRSHASGDDTFGRLRTYSWRGRRIPDAFQPRAASRKGTNVAWLVLQTGRSARIDDFSAVTDPIGVAAREAGIKSAVGSPIVVEGHLWGVMTATWNEGPLPPDTEARLGSFTELVATAIANAESSAEIAASRRRIVGASDDARRRIVRDLHDAAACARASMRSAHGRRFPSRSTCRSAGSRRRSRRPPTSWWPRR
jgi:GAF domain-containing protein